MKKVSPEANSSKSVKSESKEPTNVSYAIEDMNKVLGYLSNQKFSEVADLIDVLRTKGKLS